MDRVSQLIELFGQSVEENHFVRLTLSRPMQKDQVLKKVIIKLVLIKGKTMFSFVYREERRDLTKNFSLTESTELVKELLTKSFYNANLMTVEGDYALEYLPNKKYKLIIKQASVKVLPQRSHDKEKPSHLSKESYLVELGVLDKKGRIQKDKGDKFKQINKFVEIVESHIAKSKLLDKKRIRVHDMGAGKGYLTFALYDFLKLHKSLNVQMTGVEIRQDLVMLCNDIAKKVGFDGLGFEKGFISNYDLEQTDILMALHACDTATDDAIYKGITAGAELIICSPCCHKQIRRELKDHGAFSKILDHGILKERQAEILTDSMRALMMEAMGYKTKVFEFIASDHTGKNLMIIGQKQEGREGDKAYYLEELRKLKQMYGIKKHYLEELLNVN